MRTVHVALEPARVFVPQLSVVIVNSVGLVPVSIGAEHPVAVAVPEFVRVKVWVPESSPTLTFPKSWVRGVQARLGAVPVTVIWFVVVVAVPPKVHVRERVADFVPFVVGFAWMRTVQVALPPASVFVPQLSVAIVKFVVSVRVGAAHPVAVAVPEFVRVNVWSEEVEPTFRSPKS
jgi:hypothetical protein